MGELGPEIRCYGLSGWSERFYLFACALSANIVLHRRRNKARTIHLQVLNSQASTWPLPLTSMAPRGSNA